MVEVWADEFPVRVLTAYGPQLSGSLERKRKFWDFLEKEANSADKDGAGFVLQMSLRKYLYKERYECAEFEWKVSG